MKSFFSKYGGYIFVILVLVGWIIIGNSGNYFLIIFYLLYVALFLGLLNVIKYRHLDLYSVPKSEIKRQIRLQSFITLIVSIIFLTFKLQNVFPIEILIVFIIVFILSMIDVFIKILDLKNKKDKKES